MTLLLNSWPRASQPVWEENLELAPYLGPKELVPADFVPEALRYNAPEEVTSPEKERQFLAQAKAYLTTHV